MGVYKYIHDWCGMDQKVFLKGVEQQTIVMPCYRCGRNVKATKIRDKSVKTGEADGTVGILRHENTKRYL